MNNQPDNKHPAIGRYCIVRTYSAGVHLGIPTAINGKEVTLTGARRLWYWEGAFTLSAVALDGIRTGKLSAVLPEIYLPEAIEIIPVSEIAAKQLQEFKEYKP